MKTYSTSDIGLAAWFNMATVNAIDGPPRLRLLKAERVAGGKFEFVFLDPEDQGAELAIAYTRTESALHDQHVRNMKAMVLNRSSDGVDSRTPGTSIGRSGQGSVGTPSQGRSIRSGP